MKRTPLRRTSSPRRKTPLKPWRRAPDDRVTPEVASFVKARDGWCVAYLLGADGRCKAGSMEIAPTSVWLMTLDHVHDGPTPAAGKRAPSDADHLVTICSAHGVQSWELSHRPLLQKYLRWVRTMASPLAAVAALTEEARG